MTTLTETMHYGEFIGETAMGIGYHADQGTLISGQNLQAGTVVGLITASSKFTQLAPAAADGSQTAGGILMGGTAGEGSVNAAAADKKGVFFRRGPATVNGNDLVWPGAITGPQKTAALAQLLSIGIKVL